jgi:hypothetical protein
MVVVAGGSWGFLHRGHDGRVDVMTLPEMVLLLNQRGVQSLEKNLNGFYY